jgi:hypothetical protein
VTREGFNINLLNIVTTFHYEECNCLCPANNAISTLIPNSYTYFLAVSTTSNKYTSEAHTTFQILCCSKILTKVMQIRILINFTLKYWIWCTEFYNSEQGTEFTYVIWGCIIRKISTLKMHKGFQNNNPDEHKSSLYLLTDTIYTTIICKTICILRSVCTQPKQIRIGSQTSRDFTVNLPHQLHFNHGKQLVYG